ncbi:S1 family peptidase [Vibrio inusitatus]|nr:serine protease [Vibrio inusitatus]
MNSYFKLALMCTLFSFSVHSNATVTKSASPQNTSYIVNGLPANVHEYSSFVSLYINAVEYGEDSYWRPYCGGVLIDNDYVLTAAHCIYDDNDAQLYTSVVFKPHNVFYDHPLEYGQSRRISDIYYRKDYIDTGFLSYPNDIAILKLESSPSIGLPVARATDERYRKAANQYFVAVGHGRISMDTQHEGELLKTNLHLVDKNTCSLDFNNILDSHLCFGGNYNYYTGLKNSTCNGDSGGPVYWQHDNRQTLVGITSFGPKLCGHPGMEVTSVFTEVADYDYWITDVLNNQIDPENTVHLKTEEQNRVTGVVEIVSNEVQEPEPEPDQMNEQSNSSGGGTNFYWVLLIGLIAAHRRAAKD